MADLAQVLALMAAPAALLLVFRYMNRRDDRPNTENPMIEKRVLRDTKGV